MCYNDFIKWIKGNGLIEEVGTVQTGLSSRAQPNLSSTKLRIPYRTKIRRTKVSKFQPSVENFVRRNILSVENFVQYLNTKVKQKSDKTVEISA